MTARGLWAGLSFGIQLAIIALVVGEVFAARRLAHEIALKRASPPTGLGSALRTLGNPEGYAVLQLEADMELLRAILARWFGGNRWRPILLTSLLLGAAISGFLANVR